MKRDGWRKLGKRFADEAERMGGADERFRPQNEAHFAQFLHKESPRVDGALALQMLAANVRRNAESHYKWPALVPEAEAFFKDHEEHELHGLATRMISDLTPFLPH